MTQHYQFGIEEEFFVIDVGSKAMQKRIPAGFHEELGERLGSAARHGGLQWRVGTVSAFGTSMREAQDELRHLRRSVGQVGAQHGLGLMAAGTHPTASWEDGRGGKGDKKLKAAMADMRASAPRSMVCSLHVHVALPDPDMRVDVMRRIVPYIPHFIALSTSSPFWGARQTGVMGYRLAAHDDVPRTGLPEMFENNAAYERYVDALASARMMDASGYVWWVVRPALDAPWLELRAPDSCTRLEDAVAIAALYRALVRFLVRNPHHNARADSVDHAIAAENKWRAQRYGVHGSFVDLAQRRAISVRDAVEGVLNLVSDDAADLGCLDEMSGVRAIVEQGTSADMQLAVFQEAQHRMGNKKDALKAVKHWLAQTTLH
ncbi:carboxylate-amine ligase [Xanthobacter sp. TB0139]|uniref:carboxylate-amine ligase n=1 Tax=Xanthobacter sp. TB0139 TaxID=3459178 RepID=UPI00403A5397